MPPHRPERRQLFAALLVIVVALVAVVIARTSPATPGARVVESIFQDDDHLLYAATPIVARTLDMLTRLGVGELRVTILWKYIAPAPAASLPPPGFRAADPGDYPPGAWAPDDRLVRLARARGIGLLFDLTAPGPRWAMASHPPSRKFADHWAPSAQAFGQFARAVGTRYSGHYSTSPGTAPLPRVNSWSIWNEPNQPGWLAPQWVSAPGTSVPEAPALYRAYVDGAWSALVSTGHVPVGDTILVGDLAPEGSEGPFAYGTATPPLTFLRALYCVDGSYRPLRGAAAAALACPRSGSRSAFVSSNPGLFAASGFAHHPYSFFLPPEASLPDPNFAPLSDLPRLERALDRTFAGYGLDRRLSLWLTEYGYETNPPNPFRGVSPRLQSRYLNEAQYMAFRDPRVRAMSQFLLYDALPDLRYRPGTERYWSTFQTGLLYVDGTPKPSLNSYRLPLFIPDPVLAPGRRVLVWAMLRDARPGTSQPVRIEWRPDDAAPYRVIAHASAQRPGEVVIDRVILPGPGVIRVVWTSPSGNVVYSRGSGVRG